MFMLLDLVRKCCALEVLPWLAVAVVEVLSSDERLLLGLAFFSANSLEFSSILGFCFDIARDCCGFGRDPAEFNDEFG